MRNIAYKFGFHALTLCSGINSLRDSDCGAVQVFAVLFKVANHPLGVSHITEITLRQRLAALFKPFEH